MENRKQIENELGEIAPGLIGMPLGMPFYLPQNYFEHFISLLLERKVGMEHEELPAILMEISNYSPYHLPTGYFERLPFEILEKLGLLQNDQLPNILSDIQRTNLFHMPVGYFENLPAQMLEQALAQNETLENISKENIYTVPAGYFEGLADSVLGKINQNRTDVVPAGYFEALPEVLINKIRAMEVANELEEVAPSLNGIQKQPVNFVPEGYFVNLETAQKEDMETGTKVISIKKKSSWRNYAAAACLLGVIAFGALKMNNKTGGTAGPIAAVPVVDTSLNFSETLARLDDATIENYLKDDETIADAVETAYQPEKDDDITSYLKDLSDDELKEYLATNVETPKATKN